MMRKHKKSKIFKQYLMQFALSAMTLAINQAWAQDNLVTALDNTKIDNNGLDTTKPDNTSDSSVSSDGPTPSVKLDAVTVTGKALSIQKSILEKKSNDVISDGVSADEVGSIPDFGLGEAVQRIPGVNMLQYNNRCEAQLMTLRGFNRDYNIVTIDGVALPSTETTRRTVSLDVLPASLPRQITIYKSLTPDMEGGAIGGIADLRTRSAFDTNGLFASVKGNYADWENKRQVLGYSKPSGDIEGTISNNFGSDNQFGFVLSGNYYRRESSSLDTAADNVSYYSNLTGT